MVRRTRTEDIVADATIARDANGFAAWVTFYWNDKNIQVDRASVVSVNGDVLVCDGSACGCPSRITVDANQVDYLDYPAMAD